MARTTKKKTVTKKKRIPGNFRGKEDLFFTKIVAGVEKFFESPFKK